MLKGLGLALLAAIVAGAAYLLFWPVPIEPVAWDAPDNPGYSGSYIPNGRLAGLTLIPLDGRTGPEDAATSPRDDIYVSTHGGEIMRIDSPSGELSVFADTQGRPLGLEFGREGTLYVADAYRGLLAVDGQGGVTVLAAEDGEGGPIRYADDVDVAADGTVYFSDASTRFGAEDHGGTLPATVLDLIEHGGHGRVLKYDPRTKTVETVLDGLQFANGVALTEDGRALIVVETGSYRILRLWLEGERAGEVEALIENLPGFPDNVNRAGDGTFWAGLASPRSGVIDALADRPFLRKVIQRLPTMLRPKVQRHGFVLHFDQDGNILETLQDPAGGYALTTGAADGPEDLLLITSLTEDSLGVVPR